MDERRAEEGIEHLQAAAHELIAAARVFLDSIEQLIEEPERVKDSIVAVVDLVRDATARRSQPWESHAWSDPFTDASRDASDGEAVVDVRDHGSESTDAGSRPTGMTSEQSEGDASEAPAQMRTPKPRATGKRAADRRTTVKRISVD